MIDKAVTVGDGSSVILAENFSTVDHTPSVPEIPRQTEETFTEPISDISVTKPEKCAYYSQYNTKPFTFEIETNFGEVKVSAEPFQKIQNGSGQSRIWLEFQTPEGLTLTKTIKAVSDKKTLPRLAKECGVLQKWERQRRRDFSVKIENSDHKFKVRIVGDDDYEWVENCILKTVPNQPAVTHFMFTTPKNTVITAHFGEFEEM